MRVPFGELPGNGEIGAEMRDADGKERGSETEREIEFEEEGGKRD
jgi:hypothetical protein